MKGYKSVLTIALLIIVLTFEILTGIKLGNELTNADDYVQINSACIRNNLFIGSAENEFYIFFKADYKYVVGTSSYSFSEYQFLNKTIGIGDTKTVRYNKNKPGQLYESIDNLVIKLIIGLIIAALGAFFLYRIIIFA
jgi:hypothetical protein